MATKVAAKPISKPTVKPPAKAKPVITAAKPKPKGDVAKPVSKSRKGDSIAIFIDIDNTNASVTNVLEIISILKNYGYIAYGKLYGYTEDKAADYGEIVAENRLETAGRLRFKVDGTSVIDTRLIMESVALTEKNRFDSVFIWAAAGELTPLFERLRELDAKTVTVDLPDFDCKNKFVNQALKLFSPHNAQNFTQARPRFEPEHIVSPPSSFQPEPEPPPPPPRPAPPAPAEPPKVPGIDFDNAPQLPRKKGAPGFGAAPGEAAGQEEEMDPEEYRKMLISSAAAALNRVRNESQIKNEFGSVDTTDSFGFDDVKTEPEPESKFEPTPEPTSVPEPASVDDAPWLKPEPLSATEAERLYNTQDESKKYDEDSKKHNYDEGKTVPVSTYEEPERPDTTFTDFGDFGSLGSVPGDK